eukprot:GHRQ01021455.1.p1 GENE.GHRQ01021455.1~~GHRQ01021455.1.p1  ORF type:complete len:175 (-),score=50.81 GHRQ01021455.1:813-1337(-)
MLAPTHPALLCIVHVPWRGCCTVPAAAGGGGGAARRRWAAGAAARLPASTAAGGSAAIAKGEGARATWHWQLRTLGPAVGLGERHVSADSVSVLRLPYIQELVLAIAEHATLVKSSAQMLWCAQGGSGADVQQLLQHNQHWAERSLPSFLAALQQHGWQLDKLFLPRPEWTAEW